MMKPDSRLALVATSVDVAKSVAQIEHLVARMGATGFSYRTQIVNGEEFLEIAFRLNELSVVYPVNIRKIFETLKARYRRPPKARAIEDMKMQAKRIAARQLYEMVRVILIAVEYGLMEMKDAFLANIQITAPNGDQITVGQLLSNDRLLAAQSKRLMLTEK
jgi:hypothetical protein